MKYEIQIPKPCNAKWREMTPTEQGAFCANCSTEVYDFTNKSNYQIAKFLDTDRKLCAKFKPEQLNRDISSLENTKYSKTGLLLAVTTLLSISTPIVAQSKLPEIIKTEPSDILNASNTNSQKLNDSIQFKGTVFDQSDPLYGAYVFFKGQSSGVETDFDGNFSISIEKKDITKNLVLVISYIGLETQEIKIHNKTKFITVEMPEPNHLLGEVVVVKKQNIFRRIGNFFKKKN